MSAPLWALQGQGMGGWGGPHRPWLEVLLPQAPALAVEAVVDQVLLHHSVTRVEEHVAGDAAHCILHVVHCGEQSQVTRG